MSISGIPRIILKSILPTSQAAGRSITLITVMT